MTYTPDQARKAATWCRDNMTRGPARAAIAGMLESLAAYLDQPVIDDTPMPNGRKTFPFNDMDVGDYFDAPLRKMRYLRNEAVRVRHQTGAVFKTSQITGQVCRCMRFA